MKASFSGVLAGAAAVAIAGAVALAWSFRSSKDGGVSWEGRLNTKGGPGRRRSPSGHARPRGARTAGQ